MFAIKCIYLTHVLGYGYLEMVPIMSAGATVIDGQSRGMSP